MAASRRIAVEDGIGTVGPEHDGAGKQPDVRPADHTGADGSDDVQSAILTPDGSTVVASVTCDGPGHLGRG